MDLYVLIKNESQNINIHCKCCTLKIFDNNLNENTIRKSKKMLSAHHRFSSRQKAILLKKIVDINEKDMSSSETSDLIEGLAIEIGCTKKSLTYYVNKHLSKKKLDVNPTEIVVVNNKEAEKIPSNPITLMIEELNKLDKILAPNKFPFIGRTHLKYSKFTDASESSSSI